MGDQKKGQGSEPGYWAVGTMAVHYSCVLSDLLCMFQHFIRLRQAHILLWVFYWDMNPTTCPPSLCLTTSPISSSHEKTQFNNRKFLILVRLHDKAQLSQPVLGAFSLKSIQDRYIVRFAFWARMAPFQFKSSSSIILYPSSSCSLPKFLFSLFSILQNDFHFLCLPLTSLFINLKGAAKLLLLG